MNQWNKTNPRRLDLMTFQHWLKESTKPIPRTRFDDFPAMAPEVDKTSPRRLDLMIFEPWIQESTKLWFSWICYLAGTRALVMESWFDVYFRKWCSGANQMAFHDSQKSLQNHAFSRIVYLASTRAPVIAAHWCSGKVLLAPGSSLGAHGRSWWLLA